MKMLRLALLTSFLSLLASTASADAIGGCPSGQIWRGNPTPPGAMHHGGGECVPDPSASHGCSVSHGRGDGALAIGLVLAVVITRRVRVRVR